MIRQQLPQGDLQSLRAAIPTTEPEVQHLGAITIQPSWGESGGRLLLLKCIGSSGHLGCPAPLPHHLVGAALAASGEVVAIGDQALMQLAGEHRDAVDAGVVAEL